MDTGDCIYYLQTNKLSADDKIALLELGRGNHSSANMVEKTVKVQLHGELEKTGLFSVNMTDNEIIDSVIKTFNGKNQQVKAVKSFAKVVK